MISEDHLKVLGFNKSKKIIPVTLLLFIYFFVNAGVDENELYLI